MWCCTKLFLGVGWVCCTQLLGGPPRGVVSMDLRDITLVNGLLVGGFNPLKKFGQIGNLPQMGRKITNI